MQSHVFATVELSVHLSFHHTLALCQNDRYILSVAQIFGRDCSFWQYKVCADIRSGSLERRRQRTVGLRVKARLEHLFLAFKKTI